MSMFSSTAGETDARLGRSRRGGLTVLELMVSAAILVLLLAILLPVINASRESARRTHCTHHLRQLGVGLHAVHARHGRLPTGLTVHRNGYTAFGWGMDLLAELDQAVVDAQLPRSKTLASVAREAIDDCSLSVFLCPSDIILPTFELRPEEWSGPEIGSAIKGAEGDDEPLAPMELPTANYVGVFGTHDPHFSAPEFHGDGAFIGRVPRRFREFERGLSATLIVGERTMARLPSTWLGTDLRGEDGASRLLGGAFTAPNTTSDDECGFSSRHSGGVNFLWGDGHVSFVSDDIDTYEYHRLARIRAAGRKDE